MCQTVAPLHISVVGLDATCCLWHHFLGVASGHFSTSWSPAWMPSCLFGESLEWKSLFDAKVQEWANSILLHLCRFIIQLRWIVDLFVVVLFFIYLLCVTLCLLCQLSLKCSGNTVQLSWETGARFRSGSHVYVAFSRGMCLWNSKQGSVLSNIFGDTHSGSHRRHTSSR